MTKQDIAEAREWGQSISPNDYLEAKAWLSTVYSPDSLVSVRDKLDQAYVLVKRMTEGK